MTHKAAERARIIAGMRRTRDETEQIFIDIAHWNACVRKPYEAPIDPDPDGKLRDLIDGLSRALDNDKGHGPIAPFMPAWFVKTGDAPQ